jgi:DNA-directed RNA polymerase subunit RPC12/RpoP
MPITQATPFQCPTCGAEYKLVRVETKETVPDQQITCRKCSSPLPAAEDRSVLKYFLLAHRARRHGRHRPKRDKDE